MIKTKTKKRLKRALSCVLAFVMTASMSTVLPAAAEEVERYPYVILAADKNTGITVDADGFTLNGNANTNGEFSLTSSYSNINGKITDIDDVEDKEETEEFDVSSDMIFMHNKLTTRYFTDNCLTFDESYTYTENNVNVHNPIYVTGELNLEGNVTLNNAIGAVSDIELSDGNLNGNNTVIYSKFGDIDISGGQTSVNGLIYAPFGTVTIDSDNFNLNGVIIAQSVVISCEGNVNINYNYGVGEMIGVESEELSLDEADIPYLEDTDSDELFDVFEIIIGTDKTNPDTDGDKLTDGYEVLYLGTDPTVVDSDENGVSDADEDFDEDGLTNIQEYEKETDPYNEDTDGDELKDGEEVNTYFTNPIVADTDEDGLDDGDEIHFNANPLNPDTDGDGIPDGNKKRFQTFIHEAENKDSAVTEVRVSMTATGNLEKTTTVESIMGKDILCSEVVGLVGEPFSIETTSEFDKATITYVIDKSKLGETEFDNLLFLWYDEENDEFVELDTILDEENSTVSVETTHFSSYMLVDQVEWFEAWRKASLYFEEHNEPLASVICYDCSGSMISNDPDFMHNVFDDTGRIVYSYPTCYRKLAIDNFIDSMKTTDLTALVSFETSATLVSGFSDDKNALKNLVKPYNKGLTNAQAAIDIALDELSTAKHWYSRHIILLSDGDVNVTDAQLLQAKKAEIKIHTIGLGAGANNKELQKYADETGGQFFVAATADELDEIYQDLALKNHFDLKGLPDEDEDGLPDEFEVSGMILPNGQIFYTDSEIKDCDGDNLADGEEIFIDYSETQFVIKKDKRGGNIEYSTVVFGYKSNPWVEDTDGDGYTDYDEWYLYDTNPTVSNIAKIASLTRSEYINIIHDDWDKASFGGNQSWFGNEKINDFGCGLISSCDILIYLGLTRFDKYSFVPQITYNSDGTIRYSTYYNFVQYYYNNYYYFIEGKDTKGTYVADKLEEYMSDYGVKSKVYWANLNNIWNYEKIGFAYLDKNYNVELRSRKAILNSIKNMIEKDIPSMLAIGPYSTDEILLYDSIEAILLSDPNNKTKDHYVTVTAIYYDDIVDDYYLEISSWGKKYYISYCDFADKKDIFSGETVIVFD